MRYLLLTVEPRGQRETRSEEEGRALYAEMVRFGEGLAARVPFEVPRGLPRCSKSSVSSSTKAMRRPRATTGCVRRCVKKPCASAASSPG